MSDCLFIHGDARRLPIDPKSIDAIVTDPPYGMNALDGSRNRRYKESRSNNWDCKPMSGEEVASLLRIAPKVVIWGMNYLCTHLPLHKCFLVWNKPHVAHLENRSSAELAFTNIDGPSDAIEMRCDPDPVHPTQKPIALMRWCIQKLKLKPNSLIVDPYCGSGSTAIAAELEGHRFIGLDLDRDYLKIAKTRIEHPNRHIPRPGRKEFHPLFDRPNGGEGDP